MSNNLTKKTKNVLIVEDDDIQKIVLERLVNQIGHTVIGSSSAGSKAIESALRIGAVDLILMDINLADDVDGIDAAKQISEHREVKLVYITGTEDPEVFARAQETSFVDYLIKPVSEEMLEEAFGKAFPSEN